MATKKTVKKKVVKKPSTKSPSLFSKYWKNYRRFIILAGLVVAIVTYWVVAQELPKRAEKRDLIQKHQKLEAIADQVINLEENSASKTNDSYCYVLSGFKYEKKQEACLVRVKVTYSDISIDKANLIKNSTSKILNLEIKKSGDPSSSQTNFSEKLNNSENSYFAIISTLDNCSAGFDYFVEHEIFSIDLSCAVSPAKDTHFPLKKIS